MHWIVGDIHGMLRPLEALLEVIGRYDTSARFLFAGDYVNRGPESRRVIDLLLTLPNARFLRGNHDDIFDQVLNGQSYAPNASLGDRLVAFQWFVQHGLDNTLMSYGADLAEIEYVAEHPSESRLEKMLSGVPEAHRRFVRELEPVIEEPGFFVAHGKWDPDESDLLPSIGERLAGSAHWREIILWGRFMPEELIRPKAWHRTGYFGHTPVENYPVLLPQGQFLPICAPKMVLMDTGAALSPLGRLTAFCHETQSFLQTNHFGQFIGPRVPDEANTAEPRHHPAP